MGTFDDNGLELATIEELKADIEQRQLAKIHPSLDLSSDQPLGQLNGIEAERQALIWELAQYVWNSLNPNAARGVALDNAHALIGMPRLPARRSTVALRLVLNAGTELSYGSMVGVAGQDSNDWQIVNPFTAPEDGAFLVGFESVNEGNATANPGTITNIKTPVAGWISATNESRVPLVGRARESDEDYRQRRLEAAQKQGDSTIDSLRTALLNVRNVAQAVVVENDSHAWSGMMPPNSIEAIIYDDDNTASDSEIAEAIWANKVGGIQGIGDIVAIANDSDGKPHRVYFSRGSRVRIVVSMTVQVLSGWTDQGLADLRKQILNTVRLSKLGEDFLALKYKSIAISQPNAYNVTAYDAGRFGHWPADQDIPIGGREIASLADVDLTITIVNIGEHP